MFEAVIDGEVVAMESDDFFAWLLPQCSVVICSDIDQFAPVEE
jgi:hypothetical protein